MNECCDSDSGVFLQSLEDWGSGSVEGSIGDFGQCVCNVFLPDTSFPADRVEHMQTSSTDLAVEIKLQINKVEKDFTLKNKHTGTSSSQRYHRRMFLFPAGQSF